MESDSSSDQTTTAVVPASNDSEDTEPVTNDVIMNEGPDRDSPPPLIFNRKASRTKERSRSCDNSLQYAASRSPIRATLTPDPMSVTSAAILTEVSSLTPDLNRVKLESRDCATPPSNAAIFPEVGQGDVIYAADTDYNDSGSEDVKPQLLVKTAEVVKQGMKRAGGVRSSKRKRKVPSRFTDESVMDLNDEDFGEERTSGVATIGADSQCEQLLQCSMDSVRQLVADTHCACVATSHIQPKLLESFFSHFFLQKL